MAFPSPQELDSTILVGSLQLSLFYDSLIPKALAFLGTTTFPCPGNEGMGNKDPWCCSAFPTLLEGATANIPGCLQSCTPAKQPSMDVCSSKAFKGPCVPCDPTDAGGVGNCCSGGARATGTIIALQG